jgi:putative DNA primase/helicase
VGDVNGENSVDLPSILPPPSDPMAVARELLDEWTTDDGVLTLRHWRGGWIRWQRTHWVEVDDREIRSLIYQRVEHALYPKGKAFEKWEPTRRKIADLLEATAAVVHLPSSVDAPSWIDGEDIPGPFVAASNGLLQVPTRKLADHHPTFFNLVSVPFAYDPTVPAPTRWLRFLDQLWPGDSQSVAALQEFFGYVLSGSTAQHKILLIVGPTRSGKGTLARVLAAMIGRANVAGPTLASLGQNFGLSPLLGKPLAVISDARLAGHDTHSVVERLLTISGEDLITVDRKYRDPWTGRLPTRFLILSNELPNFGDMSGTIAHRMVILLMSRSWLGQENIRLTDELLTELPGILNWSLDGLARLTERGAFTEPASSVDAVLTLIDSASPTSAFVRDRCVVGAGFEIEVDVLYRAWRDWCEVNGRDRPGSVQAFGRALRSVVPGMKMTRPRDGEDRPRRYQGLTLKHLARVEPTMARTADQRGPTSSKGPMTPDGPRWSATQPNVGSTKPDTVARPHHPVDAELDDLLAHPGLPGTHPALQEGDQHA